MNDLEFRPIRAAAPLGGDRPASEWQGADRQASDRQAADWPLAGPAREEPSLIAHYWSIANRRKWLILATVAAFLVGALLLTVLTTPLYTASATLEIQRETQNFAQVRASPDQSQAASDGEFYQTQYGLLASRALAERVAATLHLGDDPRFFKEFKAAPPRAGFQNGRPIPTGPARDVRAKAAGGLLLARIKVAPVRLSRLVDISFTSPDPALSKRVIDAWSEEFIQTTLERRYASSSYARRFLEERLAQLRARIDTSERAVVGYASREHIVNIPGPTPTGGQGEATGERSLMADDLVNLNRELAQATADRVQAQSRVVGSGNTKEMLDNGAVTALRTRRAELAADYARLIEQFEPGYPPARALQAQIATVDAALRGESGRVSGVLQQTYAASVAREKALADQVALLTGRVLDFRRRSIQYDILQREADTNRQLYDALLQRYKEIGVAGGVGVNNIAVVDGAELPGGPSSPRLGLDMGLGLLAGLLAGAGLALLAEQIDEGITNPGEVEALLGLPLLGLTPRLGDTETPVAVLRDPKAGLTEAYASITANLGFSTSHGVPRTLAVTSSRAGEGKSSTSYALARLLARSHRRVVLVDADMRSPSVHSLLGLELGTGLSNYLAGSDQVAELIRPTDLVELAVITAGPQPPSTPELLSSDRLGRLLAALGEEYDHVILDLPPVMGLADAPLIASQVEGTVFILAAHATHKNMARQAIARLQAAHAHMLGAVLSMFDAKQANYGYGYGYGYGYDYGAKNQRSR